MALDEPDHEFVVPARTLSSLLDEVGAPEVDLLSTSTWRATRPRCSPGSSSNGMRLG